MARAWTFACALLALGCAATGSAPGDARGVSQNGAAPVTRPVPPSDLDARLIASYPLRGQVLQESGFARVRFTVAANGTVSTEAEALKATHPAYAQACRRMLEASTWTPARDAADNPVAYSATFDCAFEHSSAAASRTTQEAPASLPVRPDYGADWFERYGGEHVSSNREAELRIAVEPDGRVSVLGQLGPGDEEVARACRAMLEDGPRWQPALDRQGGALRYETTFVCRVNLEAQHKQLVLADVGAAGPLPVERVASLFAEHLPAFTHCFESAFGMGKKVHGKHWLAFEVAPSGAVGRLEWVERPLEDEILETCVFSAVRGLRFPASAGATIADVQLEAGGVATVTRGL